MVLRMSSLFVRTLREDPADAEVPSHRLLVRAGYIRRTAAGIYSWLPLGKRVLDNVARIQEARGNLDAALRDYTEARRWCALLAERHFPSPEDLRRQEQLDKTITRLSTALA